MENPVNYSVKLLDCPFCKCEPIPLGYAESRKKYGIDSDQCTIHCPGCGIDMKEIRKDNETENETYERLVNKWQLRDKTLGVDIDHLIHTLDRRAFIITNLLGKQKEIIGLIASFSDPSLDDSKYNFEYRHTFIINQIKGLQSLKRAYKDIAILSFTLIVLILAVLRLTIFK